MKVGLFIHCQKDFNQITELEKLKEIKLDWIYNFNLIQFNNATWFPYSFKDRDNNFPIIGESITLEDWNNGKWKMVKKENEIIFSEVLKSLENEKINHQIKDLYCVIGTDGVVLEESIKEYLNNYVIKGLVEDIIIGENNLVEQWSIFKTNASIYIDLSKINYGYDIVKKVAKEVKDFKGYLDYDLMDEINKYSEIWVFGFSKTHVYWSMKDILINNPKMWNKIKIVANYLNYDWIENDLREDYKLEIDKKLIWI